MVGPKMDSLLAQAESTSDAGGTSVIIFRKGKSKNYCAAAVIEEI